MTKASGGHGPSLWRYRAHQLYIMYSSLPRQSEGLCSGHAHSTLCNCDVNGVKSAGNQVSLCAVISCDAIRSYTITIHSCIFLIVTNLIEVFNKLHRLFTVTSISYNLSPISIFGEHVQIRLRFLRAVKGCTRRDLIRNCLLYTSRCV